MREYGVTTSRADYWIHVCPKDAAFYLYPRQKIVNMLGQFKRVEIPTAIGFLVPIIPNLRTNGGIIRPYDFSENGGYKKFKKWSWKADTDAEIGKMGEECVQYFASSGDLTLPVKVSFCHHKKDQYKGLDFSCELFKKQTFVEIKTEVVGGIWGTGNLFVQTHERQHHRNGT